MKRMALLLTLSACSGTFVVVPEDPPDASIDASPADASTGTDGGTVTDGGAIKDARPDVKGQCERLRLKIDELRKELLACCPFCGALQCTTALDDLCCPISTSKGGTTQAQEFTAAVKEFKATCGPIACPAVPCRIAPSNDCDPQTSMCR